MVERDYEPRKQHHYAVVQTTIQKENMVNAKFPTLSQTYYINVKRGLSKHIRELDQCNALPNTCLICVKS